MPSKHEVRGAVFTTTATVRPRLTLTSSTVPGTFTVPMGDSLTLTGGSPTMTLVNNGLLVLQDAMTLNGSLTTAVGSTISVRSNVLVGSSTVTIPNGFTNNGLIELTTADGGYTTTLAVTTGTLTNAGLLGGIGFTMSLFIGTLAFGEGPLLDAAKIAVLGASVCSGVAGWLVLRGAARST